MLSTLVVLAALAATPDEPVKLAQPGLTFVNLKSEVGEFYSDHFAQQLSLAGVKVVTAKEIGAVIGLERQKQLLGCSEDSSSCIAELANALGVDGIVTGSVGLFSGRHQINLKVLAASDASTLTLYSAQATSDGAVLDELTKAARKMAGELAKKTGKTVTPVAAGGSAVSSSRLPVAAARQSGTGVAGYIIGTGLIGLGSLIMLTALIPEFTPDERAGVVITGALFAVPGLALTIYTYRKRAAEEAQFRAMISFGSNGGGFRLVGSF